MFEIEFYRGKEIPVSDPEKMVPIFQQLASTFAMLGTPHDMVKWMNGRIRDTDGLTIGEWTWDPGLPSASGDIG